MKELLNKLTKLQEEGKVECVIELKDSISVDTKEDLVSFYMSMDENKYKVVADVFCGSITRMFETFEEAMEFVLSTTEWDVIFSEDIKDDWNW